jgi:hypothetical protein
MTQICGFGLADFFWGWVIALTHTTACVGFQLGIRYPLETVLNPLTGLQASSFTAILRLFLGEYNPILAQK